ncbi:MAG: PD-(D/E)XK nuclease family protein [Pseudomonadota bacterium]
MSADAPVILVPYGDDPLRHLATLLLERHEDRLPDLSRQTVLLPHASAVPRFRRLLRAQAEQKGFPALLPPITGTLTSWAARFAGDDQHHLSSTARQILLLDLLHDYPRWLRQYGDWPLVDSLLALFDELALHAGRLSGDADSIRHVLAGHGANTDEISPFSDEAQLVQELWDAWRERLTKNNLQDPVRRHTDGLARSLERLPAGTNIYLAGFADFPDAEIAWIRALMARGGLTLLLHGSADNVVENPVTRLLSALTIKPHFIASADAYADFLDRVFATDAGHLHERAQQQAKAAPASPARGRLTLHQAADAESEARAIDLQVRRWLTQDRHDIGIVTNDRKLARRVRALLERANVGLVDAGGWALSTTSAATSLARWLECVEQNFSHAPLLDLLKSPFLQPGIGRTQLDRLVPVFERDVVRAGNITSGLEHYHHGLERAVADSGDGTGETWPALTQLLERLADAAAPLLPLLSARPRPALEFLAALQTSLEKLGLAAGFENDDAGRELLQVLDEMRAASAHNPLRLAWAGFHQWLRRGMEQRRFHPPMQGSGVELMSFSESRLYRFDALIIAGAVREHLPGQICAPPYFNDGARSELGLPSLARRYAVLFQDFRRLLEAAPRVMVSLRREQDGERLAPSPWVERIRAFHALAYDESLGDPELEWLVQQPAAVIAQRSAPLPAPVTPPAAHLPPAMLPAMFTATDCQRLLDCPYQFFAARGLGLAPEDEVREEIEKVDYGIHVHRILQAFHTGVPGLPGPWREQLDHATRAEAEALLREISERVFARDLRRRFLARGWRYRWEQCIPAYLDWEMQRAADWKVEATELKRERVYRKGATQIALTGRIDRLDHGRDGYAIIDYKTGTVPARDPVERGEKIQLPFYALLLEQGNVASAAFLALDDEEAKEKTALEGEALDMLRDAIRARLLQIKRGLDTGAPLPAWGDMETCRLCDMEGLCRREMWAEPDTKTS